MRLGTLVLEKLALLWQIYVEILEAEIASEVRRGAMFLFRSVCSELDLIAESRCCFDEGAYCEILLNGQALIYVLAWLVEHHSLLLTLKNSNSV